MSSSMEMLKNLMILQLEAFKALAAEHHQHTEAYVQQFGKLPLTQEPSRAAHEARISLRSSSSASPSLADGCAVSEVILEATKWHCGADMCATSPKHLEMFLEIARNDVKTTEDRVHALFVLNASLSGKEMRTQFESKQGYELLVEWFAAACTYSDATSKGFSDLLLRVLQRNVPNMSFTTKTVLKSLSQYKKLVVGKDNKALLQTVLSQYRDKITQ